MDVLYWIWLTTCNFVGPVLQKNLFHHFQEPRAIFEADEKELKLVKGMNKRAAISILDNRSLTYSKEILTKTEKNNVQLLLYSDNRYPTSAKTCKQSPIVLYYKGNLTNPKSNVAVVGSRRCSPYGKKIAKSIGTNLAKAGIPIVSGFARGIDSYTHEACIDSGGDVIVFLAGGVDICYPKEQLSLYDKILNNDGVFISKYPPGTPPTPKKFIQRNALISAWSEEVIIVEAGPNSGALLTANYAKSQNKTLYIVPNQIDREEGIGTNYLLTNGAKPYLNIHSLNLIKNRNINFTDNKNKLSTSLFSHEIQVILQLISEAPQTISTLSKLTNTNEMVLLDQLLELELSGDIIIRGNMVFKN